MSSKIILTGDRPTGRLHIGHYVGSLRRRVEIQESGDYKQMFVFIADAQALTDNVDNPEKVRQNVVEVALDYLSIGLDPSKVTMFIQSQIPELTELTFYFLDLVSVARLQRNPTVKTELAMRGFGSSIPVGFFTYPISQAADITAFKATTIPVGEDQSPMIEQAVEIVRRFNHIYGDTLVEPKILLPDNAACLRLPGTDGKAKMSKSLNNCIYLSETEKELKQKVMSMYTDPLHVHVEDPGHLEGNTVFTYLDAFCRQEHFAEFWPDYGCLQDVKDHYQRGGLGDMKVKKFLMVFIALPALQASQRDTARKSDVSIVSAAYNSALSNNRGGTAVNQDVLRRFVNGVSENTSIDNINIADFSGQITVKDAQIIVVLGARCGTSNPDGKQDLISGTRRQYATFTRLEAGNHAAYCLDS